MRPDLVSVVRTAPNDDSLTPKCLSVKASKSVLVIEGEAAFTSAAEPRQRHVASWHITEDGIAARERGLSEPGKDIGKRWRWYLELDRRRGSKLCFRWAVQLQSVKQCLALLGDRQQGCGRYSTAPKHDSQVTRRRA